MRVNGITEKWVETGCRYNKGSAFSDGVARDTDPATWEEPVMINFEIKVASTLEGKVISLYDPTLGYCYTIDGDLIAYWLEHGTEGE